MPDETRHESADLEDFETEDAYDTLDGELGDDPLDAGLVPPERWSAGMRFGTTDEEEADGESLDQLLAEEEPDTVPDVDDELLLDDGPEPRAGRLVADDDGADPDTQAELTARDAGIDGGAATAEEAAVHVADDDDYDIRSE